MAFPIGKGRNDQGTFQQSTFIINYTQHVYRQQKQGKALRPTITNNVQSLKQVYFSDSAPQHSFKSPKEKTPSQTRGSGWTTWVFMTRDLGDRTGPARPLQVTCTLEVPRWSTSSLRHSPPVRASTLDHRTQPSRLGAQREGTSRVQVTCMVSRDPFGLPGPVS